jgi:hypothetical protein
MRSRSWPTWALRELGYLGAGDEARALQNASPADSDATLQRKLSGYLAYCEGRAGTVIPRCDDCRTPLPPGHVCDRCGSCPRCKLPGGIPTCSRCGEDASLPDHRAEDDDDGLVVALDLRGSAVNDAGETDTDPGPDTSRMTPRERVVAWLCRCSQSMPALNLEARGVLADLAVDVARVFSVLDIVDRCAPAQQSAAPSASVALELTDGDRRLLGAALTSRMHKRLSHMSAADMWAFGRVAELCSRWEDTP